MARTRNDFYSSGMRAMAISSRWALRYFRPQLEYLDFHTLFNAIYGTPHIAWGTVNGRP